MKDVSSYEFVKSYAAHLKRSGKMELPNWSDIVKTDTFKELAPYDPGCGNKRNSSTPPHFCKASGGIARYILQQLQSMNIVDFNTKGRRKITSNGRRDLDHVVRRVAVVTP
ncbi:40S ribosomal protein S19-3-like protein [Tanacetum coccineum]